MAWKSVLQVANGHCSPHWWTSEDHAWDHQCHEGHQDVHMGEVLHFSGWGYTEVCKVLWVSVSSKKIISSFLAVKLIVIRWWGLFYDGWSNHIQIGSEFSWTILKFFRNLNKYICCRKKGLHFADIHPVLPLLQVRASSHHGGKLLSCSDRISPPNFIQDHNFSLSPHLCPHWQCAHSWEGKTKSADLTTRPVFVCKMWG